VDSFSEFLLILGLSFLVYAILFVLAVCLTSVAALLGGQRVGDLMVNARELHRGLEAVVLTGERHSAELQEVSSVVEQVL
jgi:hypothetical protein